jgi:uncharacterized LabA/DUF88 family protein
VGVFIDWQNTYKHAREVFGLIDEAGRRGVYDPVELSRILAFGNKRANDGDLVRVEIHRGIPNPEKNPIGNAAVLRHQDAWLASSGLVHPCLRPLRYHPETGKPEEKGVDVALGLSVAEHVLRDFIDVAILFSHDTDLLPVVESVKRLAGSHRIETAAWKSDDFHKRIPHVPGVVHHTLRRHVFERVETPVNYAREQ